MSALDTSLPRNQLATALFMVSRLIAGETDEAVARGILREARALPAELAADARTQGWRLMGARVVAYAARLTAPSRGPSPDARRAAILDEADRAGRSLGLNVGADLLTRAELLEECLVMGDRAGIDREAWGLGVLAARCVLAASAKRGMR